MKIRDAAPQDHAAILALYPELGVPEPMVAEREWIAENMPATVVAHDGGRVIGYALARANSASGHVVQVVVAPRRRRAGLGHTLMEELARRLRAAGCARWHLSVREDNVAAIALYEAHGLEVKYAAQVVRLGAPVIAALPPLRGARIDTAPDADAAALEARFGLRDGSLLRRRGVTLRATIADRVVGVARLSPALALAAPFRLREHRAARALLAAMPRWIDEPTLRVVVEADVKLTELLHGHGAAVELRLLHMEGTL